MRSAKILGGLLVATMGAVWTLQGLNSQLVPQSSMTNIRAWIIIGVTTLVGGLLLVRSGWIRR